MPTDIHAAYAVLEGRVCGWAAACPDVHALVLVGSRARPDHSADVFSDLDLILFVEEPAVLAGSRAWLEDFGPLWAAALDRTGENEPEWLALYRDGAKADFVLHRTARGTPLHQALAAFPYRDVLNRGLRVLVDKTPSALSGFVPFPEASAPAHPDEAAFAALVERFILQAVRAARLVHRGDLWRAKFAVDGDLKTTLLILLEWHARAAHGLHHDTWYGGRFIARWADPQMFALLPATFATFDQNDMRRGLFATITLFTRMAGETAAGLGYADPRPRLDEISGWLEGAIQHG